MKPERWQQLKPLLQSALERAPDERAAFLNEICDGDELLRRELESFIASHEQATEFIEHPAVEVVAPMFMTTQTDVAAVETIGSYNIVEKLGEGGMGVVYLAVDNRLGRKVALKLLPAHYASDVEHIRRFQREARAASALNHPNILTIHEIGQTNDGKHFIASEFVEGETLRQRLQSQTLSLCEKLEIIIQIAAALSAAHEAGLVHRDIKPENVMIRPDGLVKVLDFGLVKLIEKKNAPFDAEATTRPQVETNPGVVMGTVVYMSPEQSRGKAVDARTDIWSLGVILYEMLTGRLPFTGETSIDTISEILNKKPEPLSHHVSGTPKELERIVSKALRKNSDERYQHIKDLLIDLRDLKQELEFEAKSESSQAPMKTEKMIADKSSVITGQHKTQPTSSVQYITTRIKNHKIKVILTFSILLIAVMSVGYYYTKRKLDFQMGQVTRITSNGRVKTVIVSPDGKFVIYVQDENDGKQSLWMQHVGSDSNAQIAPPANIEYNSLNISPDGNSLYYIDEQRSLYQKPFLTGTPKKVLKGPIYFQIGFSPDGKQIAFFRASGLFIANADGTNEKQKGLTFSEQLTGLGQFLSWSPDGKVIACGFMAKDGGQNILAVRVADGVSVPILPQSWSYIGPFRWMPDSKSLLVIGFGDSLASFQVRQISYPSGEVRSVTNDTNNYHNISLTADGRFFASVRTEQVAHVWIMPANDANRARQVTVGFEKFDGVFSLGWMPDGKIVYDSSPNGNPSVWVAEADGSNPRELIKVALSPAISPDGHYLVYQWGNTADNNIGLWRKDLKDGSEKQLTKGVSVWTTFSPDSKWVVYLGYGERIVLWKVPIEGGEPIQILEGGGVCPAVSPDGKMIAYTVWDKVRKIVTVSFDDGKIIKIFDTKPESLNQIPTKHSLQWTPEGRAIYYVALNNNVSNIWRQPIDGSPPVQVTKFDTGRIFNFAFSPDGKQLALSRGTLNSDVVLIKNSLIE